VRYQELKVLLREGRASIQGRPAADALEFAEAVCSLGIDRGIDRFVRYSLLKRRGDSYVALPADLSPTLQKESDRIREFQHFLNRIHTRDSPKYAEDLRRNVDSAIYQVLRTGGKKRMLELMTALGRMLRHLATTTQYRLLSRGLNARCWLAECDFVNVAEVRIAAAVASIYTRNVGSISDNLARSHKRFAWAGVDVPARMISVLDRRVQSTNAVDSTGNPTGLYS
jgi:CRISPR-associated protein Csx17